jgi:hypothetical protein
MKCFFTEKNPPSTLANTSGVCVKESFIKILIGKGQLVHATFQGGLWDQGMTYREIYSGFIGLLAWLPPDCPWLGSWGNVDISRFYWIGDCQ